MTPDPPRRAPRSAVLPLASFVLMGLFWGAWAALVPAIQLRTGATPAELGAALLWAGGAALPAMLLAGRLWAGLGSRSVPLMLLGFGLVAVGPAVAGNVVVLALSLALVGASSGALDVTMNAQVSDIEATSGRRLMYPAHALFSLAVLVAAIACGLLRDAGVEPATVLAPIAAGMVLTAVVGLVAQGGGSPAAGPPDVPAPDTSGRGRFLARSAIVLGVLCAAAFLIEDAMTSWSALHLERSLAASPAVGGAGPGLFAGAMFIGRSLGQLVARRLSDRAVMTGAGSIAALGIVLAAWAPDAPAALAGLVIAGAGVSLVAPALFGRAGRLAGPRSRGAAIARLTVFGYTGFVVGPPIVGLIAGATDLRVAFTALAALAVGLAVVSPLALRGAPMAATTDELPPLARG